VQGERAGGRVEHGEAVGARDGDVAAVGAELAIIKQAGVGEEAQGAAVAGVVEHAEGVVVGGGGELAGVHGDADDGPVRVAVRVLVDEVAAELGAGPRDLAGGVDLEQEASSVPTSRVPVGGAREGGGAAADVDLAALGSGRWR
jgi:hypothetical protein